MTDATIEDTVRTWVQDAYDFDPTEVEAVVDDTMKYLRGRCEETSTQ